MLYFYCDLWIWWQTYWPKWQTVRRDWGYQDRVDAVLHYRTACRQWIGCWSGWCWYQYTIARGLCDFFLIDKNLQNDSFRLLPGYTHLIDTSFAEMFNKLSLGTVLVLFRLDAHYFCWGERKLNFLTVLPVIIVYYLVDNLLDLFQLKTTHETQCATLERYDWRCLMRELFGCV